MASNIPNKKTVASRSSKLFISLTMALLFWVIPSQPLLSQGIPDSLLILTEVMPDPVTGASTTAHEYVEIFNLSFSDSVSLTGWRLRGGLSGTARTLTDTLGNSVKIPPRRFALIVPFSYTTTSPRFYDALVPSGTLFIRASGTSNTSLDLSNSGSGTLARLISPSNDTVQNYFYGNSTKGFAFEKINLTRINDASNWQRGLQQGGTPGAFNSVSPRENDLTITSLSAFPSVSITQGDSVRLDARVRNLGTAASAGFLYEIYEDRDSNATLVSNERLFSQTNSSTLNSGDSLLFSNWVRLSVSGLRRFVTIVTQSGDEVRTNDTAKINITVLQSAGLDTALIFTEVMADPPSGNTTANEFVEVFNTSSTDSLNLTLYRFRAGTNSTVTISDTSDGRVWLRPRSYALIVPSTYQANERIYNALLPSGTLVVRSSGGLSLTNGGTTIRLITSTNDTIQTYTYGSQTKGFSQEKKELTRENTSVNWARALVSGGSPGVINTNTPKEKDLTISTFQPSGSSVRLGTTVVLRTVIKNLGTQTATGYRLEIFEDADSNNVVSQPERFFSQTFASTDIAPADSFNVTGIELLANKGGLRRLVAAVSFLGDESRTNDTARAQFNTFVPNDADTNIILSEVMPDPPADANSTAHEFIEVYNSSATDTIDFSGWRLRVGTGSVISLADTGDGRTRLAPRSYALIVPSSYLSTFPRFYNSKVPSGVLVLGASASLSLTNGGTTIRLITSIGDTIQTYSYSGNLTKGFSLEKVLLTRENTLQNWGRAGISGGTPGSVNTITPKAFDIGINSLTVFPSTNIRTGTQGTLRANVRNYGQQAATSVRVEVYDDRDSNEVAALSELLDTRTLSSNLASLDSLNLDFSFSTSIPGLKRFIVAATLSADEARLNDTLKTTALVFEPNFVDTNLIISEVMYDPPAESNSTTFDEYLEVYNRSETDTLNLRNWRIGGSVNLVITDSLGSNANVLIGPKQFALIFAPNYFTSPQFYKDIIPANAVLARSSGSLNFSNDGDSISIITAQGELIAHMAYVGDSKQKGKSLEKIMMTRNDSPSNYIPSLTLRGSPGRENTVTPKPFDLALRFAVRFSTPPGANINIGYTIINRGLNAFGAGATVKVYEDLNSNTLVEPEEEISSASFTLSSNLIPNDSTVRSFTAQAAQRNSRRFIIILTATGDNDLLNNRAETLLLTGTPRNAIVVNEILYQPIQSSTDFKQDQPDYVELFNRSDSTIDLRGWYLTNLPNERGEFEKYEFATDSLANYALKPGDYAVISPDRLLLRDSTRLVLFYSYLKSDSTAKLFFITSRSTFSNSTTGGLVQLVDNTDGIIDSVRYSPEWHNSFYSSTSGIALERINPHLGSNDSRNWTSSSNREFGGTPARRNAAFAETITIETQGKIEVKPNPFSPDGDGREDNAVISYKLPDNVNRIRIKIYDVRGRLVRTLANSEPTASEGSIIWDGFGENRERLRMGIYIIFLEALGANSAVVTSLKKAVVVARPLN
ncbi:MAG: lamin tail domain-containing protein [Chloroherpetonaceae bacterium]|nr:lamin tail domain-containing protein [Chloroherpetonaceae bacterium]